MFVGLLFVTCMPVKAQKEELEYQPFTRGGMIFETKVGTIKENLYVSKIDADTVINGETWRKVYNYKIWPLPSKYNTYFAAVRDVGRKVYAIAKGSTRPRLLYDFDLEEDDFIRCGMEGNAFGCLVEQGEARDILLGFPLDSYLMVERIDTVRLHDGLEPRPFILTMCDFFRYPIAGPIVWIEGLGSSAGPFSPWMTNPQPYSDETYPNYYTEYRLNKDHIAFSYEFIDAETSETPNAIKTYKPTQENDILYDLQGRSLFEKPTHGIYIEDGKKRMVK